MRYGDIRQANIEYWNNRAESYSSVNQGELAGEQHDKWLQEVCKSIDGHFQDIPRNKIKILDVGTGPGFLAIILRRAGYQVCGIDCTQGMLNEAKINALKWQVPEIDFSLMDAENLDFAGEIFHVIISRNLTWVLTNPVKAYHSWFNALKSNGLLLNFDANWYSYLFDEAKLDEYYNDRKNVSELGYDDHYLETDIKKMERIAKAVPLSKINRPAWDINELKKLNYKSLKFEINFGKLVWSDEEKVNYKATPMFKIELIKGDMEYGRA